MVFSTASSAFFCAAFAAAAALTDFSCNSVAVAVFCTATNFKLAASAALFCGGAKPAGRWSGGFY